MAMDIREILRINYPVGDAACDALTACAVKTRVRKGDALAAQGAVCSRMFLVSQGIFRMSCRLEDVDDTICFGEAGDTFMSMHSYYAREAACISCYAATDMEVYCVDFADFNRLTDEFHDLSKWFQTVLAEELYLLERRYVYFGAKDAYNRYVTFVAARPDIMKSVPAKYIAQYLKIRPETLYRLRAKYLRSTNRPAL